MSYQLWFSDVENIVRRVRDFVNSLIDPQVCVDERENNIVLVYYFDSYEDAKIAEELLRKLLRKFLDKEVESIEVADTRVDVYLKNL